jgi:GT2 family glycosyltransferase
MGSPLVFVPVFGRLDLAGRALRALDAHTPGDVAFLVVDDCGGERVAREWLEDVLKPSRVRQLVVNEVNLGFVRSANVAFALRDGHDVVVVNSDVVVYAGWLGHLQAAAGPGVASVTALSNNGSIATVRDPAAYVDVESLSLPAAQADAVPPPPYDIPVGVGHCIYFSNLALAEVGVFDEAFSPGYGEEVDWSIRASRRGWRHLAAPGVIVWHDAGASFGQRRLLRRRHELKLALRYPREFLGLRLRRFEDLDGGR